MNDCIVDARTEKIEERSFWSEDFRKARRHKKTTRERSNYWHAEESRISLSFSLVAGSNRKLSSVALHQWNRAGILAPEAHRDSPRSTVSRTVSVIQFVSVYQFKALIINAEMRNRILISQNRAAHLSPLSSERDSHVTDSLFLYLARVSNVELIFFITVSHYIL